jgi:hypothetical protein
MKLTAMIFGLAALPTNAGTTGMTTRPFAQWTVGEQHLTHGST